MLMFYFQKMYVTKRQNQVNILSISIVPIAWYSNEAMNTPNQLAFAWKLSWLCVYMLYISYVIHMKNNKEYTKKLSAVVAWRKVQEMYLRKIKLKFLLHNKERLLFNVVQYSSYELFVPHLCFTQCFAPCTSAILTFLICVLPLFSCFTQIM